MFTASRRHGAKHRYVHKLRLESHDGAVVRIMEGKSSGSAAARTMITRLIAAVLMLSTAFALGAGMLLR